MKNGVEMSLSAVTEYCAKGKMPGFSRSQVKVGHP